MHNCAIIHPLHLELETALCIILFKASGSSQLTESPFHFPQLNRTRRMLHRLLKLCRRELNF